MNFVYLVKLPCLLVSMSKFMSQARKVVGEAVRDWRALFLSFRDWSIRGEWEAAARATYTNRQTAEIYLKKKFPLSEKEYKIFQVSFRLSEIRKRNLRLSSKACITSSRSLGSSYLLSFFVCMAARKVTTCDRRFCF